MAEKVARTNISRDDKNYIYFIKDGAVWRVGRKQPGVAKGRREKVVDAGVKMDAAYIYFLDKDGDVARAKRAVGGQKRKKKAKAKKKVAKKKVAKKKAKKPAKKKVAKKKAKKPAKKAKKPAKKAKKPAKKAKKPAKKAKKPAKKKATKKKGKK